MVEASKILTVSYGTFSCTLEGFDDPFSTMRGIAEYFRDLAADDRYFGAEPPTPDAEMLHRIAEREVQNRVEARVEEDGITLRQLESTPQDADVSAASMVAAAVAPALVEDDVAEEVSDFEVAPQAARPQSVAAKLARIRALSAEEDFETGSENDAAETADDTANVSPISSVFNDAVEDVTTAEIDQDIEGVTEVEAEVEAEVVGLAQEVFKDSDEAQLEEPAINADVSPIFAEAAADAEPDAEEETVAPEMVADVEPDFEPELVQDQAKPEVVEEDTEDHEQDDSAAIASILGASLHQAEEEEPAQSDDAMEEPDGEAFARVVKMRRSDFEAAQHDNDAEDDADQETVAVEEETAPEELEAAEPEHNVSEEIDASEADDQFEDQDETTADTDADVSNDEFEMPAAFETEAEPSTLSAEDEADLMATLGKVKRQEAADMRSEKEGRALLENDDIEANTESVSRILNVTNTELEETEGTRRRSAIAHLKAAVAATRADKLLGLGKAKEEAEELDKYRDDLAKAVRPRRPISQSENPPRRQAPLVLVSEQRIDEDEMDEAVQANADMVLPRRVSSGNLALDEDGTGGDNIFRDGHSFAEFAAEMGAKELPDLLEAAAAFSSYVEGREHFSRPQIMKAVADLNEDEEYSREESLRSFGLLLRRGKIKKIKRGQFTIANTTRFNPEVRAVGE